MRRLIAMLLVACLPALAVAQDAAPFLSVMGGTWASYQVTTTGAAQTHTLGYLTVSAATMIDWGDASSDVFTGASARTHVYATAGTYTVKILQPANVTRMQLNENKITVNSADLKLLANVTDFRAYSCKAGTFNSSDVSGWRPTTFYLHSMPSGYAGTFNSADVSAWRLVNFRLDTLPSGYAGTFNSADVSAWTGISTFYLNLPSGCAGTFNSSDVSAWRPWNFNLYTMPSSYAGTFDSSDVSAWRPTYFNLSSMPSGYAGTFDSTDVSAWRPTWFNLRTMPVATFAITITANSFKNWTTGLSIFQMDGNALSQVQVDLILWELYQAAITPRTATGGTINLGGSNAAPGGTYQACASCPVAVTTPGREVAHELKNDGCAVGFNKWATVAVN